LQILDTLHTQLPNPPFTEKDKTAAADQVFEHIWQLSQSGIFDEEAVA
jgi:type I restriction enzyme R subunit